LPVSIAEARLSFSSPDTHATVSCKQKLSIASHNSLLIALLHLWNTTFWC
jgi:hypothetical protein